MKHSTLKSILKKAGLTSYITSSALLIFILIISIIDEYPQNKTGAIYALSMSTIFFHIYILPHPVEINGYISYLKLNDQAKKALKEHGGLWLKSSCYCCGSKRILRYNKGKITERCSHRYEDEKNIKKCPHIKKCLGTSKPFRKPKDSPCLHV